MLRNLNLPLNNDFFNSYPNQLSGGQLQRISLARALLLKPKILICDESVNMLDASVKIELLELLRVLQEKMNLTIIFITHDLGIAKRFCDRLLVMNEGKIHQIDTPINLLNNPKTIFVSSFILGNNIINLKKNSNSYISCLGKINCSEYLKNTSINSMSISPKFISIKRSESGNAIVLSKEFLGEYLIYKVTINGNILRVRTDINNLLNNGDKCSLSINKNSYYFLYPGAYKEYI